MHNSHTDKEDVTLKGEVTHNIKLKSDTHINTQINIYKKFTTEINVPV